MVTIIFELGDHPWKYRDALHFTEEEYAFLTQEDIETMKYQRYRSWYEAVTSPSYEADALPPIEIDPTVESADG